MAERRQVIVDLVTRTGGGTTGIRSLQGQLGGVSSGAASAKGNLKGMQGQVGGLQKGLKGLTPALSGTAVAAGAIGGGVLLAGKGIQASISAFASFDDKLNQSQAIMGNLTDTMKGDMEQAARDVAKTTRLSADEAAESYFFLASAGLDAEQSIAALPQVAAFAQAGMFDMATATDLATDAQSALGLTSDDAQANLKGLTRVTDVFVKANTLANTSVQQVSEAITNKLGGSLRAYNIDLEEGVAVLAAYADQGLKGASAGEAFNIVLRDLKRAANDNADAFAAAGVEVFDSEGNFRNMADVVGDLEGAFQGLSVQEQTNLANQLGFQDRSFKNIQLLLGQSDAIREYEGELRKAGGTTEEIAENQLDSFSGQMDLIKSQITDVGIGLGKELAPSVLEMAQGFGNMIEMASPLIGLIGKGLAGAFKLMLGPLNQAAKGVQVISSWFDEGEREALRYSEAVEKVKEVAEDGGDVYTAFANGIKHLAENGALTAETLADLASEAEVSEEAMGGALATNLEFARSNGFASDQIAVLEEALRASINASDMDAESKQELMEKYGLLAGEMTAAEAAARASIPGYENLADAEEEAAGGAEELAEEVGGLEGALAAAEAAQESLADAMKAFADPTFAAVKSIEKMQGAQAKVSELQKEGKGDSDEMAKAMIELAEANLEAQGALDSFSAQGVAGQVEVIAQALGIGDEAARELLETLGLIDGKEVTTVVTTRYQNLGAPPTALSRGSAKPPPYRHGGRIKAGHMGLVGEAGPELFVPDVAGTILPNNMLTAMNTTNQTTRNVNVTFVNPRLADDPMEGVRNALALDTLGGIA